MSPVETSEKNPGADVTNPPTRGVQRAVWAAVAVVGAGCAAASLYALEGAVLSGATGTAPTSVEVRLADAPDWMPATLVRDIRRSLTPENAPPREKELPRSVYELAEANPWVRQVVSVRRVRSPDAGKAVVVVEARFRKPLALVPSSDGTSAVLVDAEGYRVPASHAPRYVAYVRGAGGAVREAAFADYNHIPPGAGCRRVHYFRIELDHIRDGEPPEVGKRWDCTALGDALRLARLVCSRPYAGQITTIDARNHDGSLDPNEPHLRMYAQRSRERATVIRFGRFPHPGGDHVVSPARKISYLDAFVADHGGRLAGTRSYLDLRYDELHTSID